MANPNPDTSGIERYRKAGPSPMLKSRPIPLNSPDMLRAACELATFSPIEIKILYVRSVFIRSGQSVIETARLTKTARRSIQRILDAGLSKSTIAAIERALQNVKE